MRGAAFKKAAVPSSLPTKRLKWNATRESCKLEPATMLRSLSQLFNGPVVNDKGGEVMAEPMDEASTAPGSSGEEASEGADASKCLRTLPS